MVGRQRKELQTERQNDGQIKWYIEKEELLIKKEKNGIQRKLNGIQAKRTTIERRIDRQRVQLKIE